MTVRRLSLPCWSALTRFPHVKTVFSKLSTHETTHAPSAPDPKDLNTALSPHLHDVAHLRRNNSLSDPELRFLDARRTKIADSGSLAKFLQLPPGTVIDERDVPTVCGEIFSTNLCSMRVVLNSWALAEAGEACEPTCSSPV